MLGPRFWLALSFCLAACKARDPLQGAPAGDPNGPGDPSGGDPATGDNAPADSDPGLPVWREVRGVVHVHSPYSHDACDGNGLSAGEPNASCLADLRLAACAAGLDFVALTDHPSFMRDYAFTADLLYNPNAGDALVDGSSGPLANRLHCPDGHTVLVTVGYEATHTMPLGLEHHVAAAHYAGLTDATPLSDAQALVGALEAAGAVTAIAHSEESDLSAARILEAGIDAMEWYNPHGNFKTALGGDTVSGDATQVLGLLGDFGPFVQGSTSQAHPDLVYLLLLPSWPQAGFDKWREVLRTRTVTGLLGSDVHQNVAVAPLCTQSDPLQQAACIAAAEALLPPWLASLIGGGTIVLSDGQRLDAFARVLRWLENRVLVDTLSTQNIAAALRAGRSYGVFTVFGSPQGFALRARDQTSRTFVLGESTTGPLHLMVDVPARPVAMGGAPFTAIQADAAEVRTVVFHTDSTGTYPVHDSSGLGRTVELDVSAAGAYHVELWLRPRHLTAALGSEAALADREYLWVISNPLRILP